MISVTGDLVRVVDDVSDWIWLHRDGIGLAGAVVAILAFLAGLVRNQWRFLRSTFRRVKDGSQGDYERLLELFVGRQSELRLFDKTIRSTERHRQFLMNLSGPPGHGKSWLVANFLSSCRQKGIPCALADFSTPFLQGGDAVQPLLLLSDLLPAEPFAAFRSQFSATFYRTEAQRLGTTQGSDREAAVQTKVAYQQIADAFWEGVRLLVEGGKQRCVLFLDHCEEFQGRPAERLIVDDWLDRCPGDLQPSVTVVLSGWNELQWPSHLQPFVHRVPVEPFSRDEIAECLARNVAGLTQSESTSLTDAVLAATEGWPAAVGIFVTAVREAGAESAGNLLRESARRRVYDARLDDLVEDLIPRLGSMGTVVKALSVARWFTNTQYTVLLEQVGIQDIPLAEALDRLASMVRPREPEGFLVSPLIRERIYESWRRQDPEAVMECHRVLTTSYEHAQATDPSRRLHCMLESLHHRVARRGIHGVASSEVVDQFQDVFFEAEGSFRVEMQEAALAELRLAAQTDGSLEGWVRVFNGRISYWRGEWAAAADALYGMAGDPLAPAELSSHCMRFAATLAYYRGDIERAGRFVSRIRGSSSLGRPAELARFMTEVGGDVLRIQGLISEATSAFDWSAVILLAAGDLPMSSWAMLNLGNMYRLMGRWRRSETVCADALRLLDDSENPRMRARISYTLGRTFMYSGAWQEALRVHDQAISLLGQMVAPPLDLAAARRNRADLLRLVRNWRDAEDEYLLSLSICLELGARIQEGYVYGSLGELWLARGHVEAGDWVVALGLEVKVESGDRYGCALSLLVFGEMRLASGQISEARILLEEAVQKLDALEHPYMLARALARLAPISGGNKASEMYRRLRGILREARLDGDEYADIVSDLALFTAIRDVHRSPDQMLGIVLRRVVHALVWGHRFNSDAAVNQTLKFAHAVSQGRSSRARTLWALTHLGAVISGRGGNSADVAAAVDEARSIINAS